MKRIKLFKKSCVACGATDSPITKEHFWPRWLVEMTGTHETQLRWGGNKLSNALSATVPLCKRCNSDFGRELEAPVSRIFGNLQDGRGITDNEAEILIRWLWKIEGLAWSFSFPEGKYTEIYTLRERVLRPIDRIRGSLILAVGLAAQIDSTDAAMGIDSINERSAIFVAGVFSKTALMVVHEIFEDQIPQQFSIYHLAERPDTSSDARLFYPKVSFQTDSEAVSVMADTAPVLSALHDLMNSLCEDVVRNANS